MAKRNTGRPIVFAYNFPHKKTQDFLQRLVLLNQSPQAVLAADAVKLDRGVASLRVKPRCVDLIHPREICRRFGIPFFVVDHRGPACVSLLRQFSPELGLVAGARILPKQVLDEFSLGVVNFHPGLIPEVRGLDALQWAVYLEVPLGVTAHLIDARVDAGRLVERRLISEYADDTFVDLSQRLYETQLAMLSSVLTSLSARKSAESFGRVGEGAHRTPFPAEFVPVLQEKFAARKRRLAAAA